MFDYFYSQQIHLKQILRKCKLGTKNTLILGPKGAGKKNLIISYIKENYQDMLLINASEIYFDKALLKNLPHFLKNNPKIKALALLDFTFCDLCELFYEHDGKLICKDFFAKAIKDICVFISSSIGTLSIHGFDNVLLDFLDFEEYLANSKQSEPKLALNEYLRQGRMIKENKKDFLKANFTPKELLIIKQIVPKIAESFSVNKLFLSLKQTQAISKDKIYKIINSLQASFFLCFTSHINKPLSRRVYLRDFGIKAHLCYTKNFTSLFANMVYCELLKLNKPIFFSKDFDFFWDDTALKCAAFTQLDLMLLQAKKLESKLDLIKAKRLIFVSLNHEYELNLINHKIIIMRFDKFAFAF